MSTNLTISHSARAHSAVGGSSAKRVIACPGSVNLCAHYPSKSSEWAEEGTALHEAVDLILQGKVEKDTDVIGVIFNGIEITQELFDEAIEPALQIFDDLDKELGGIEFFNETRVVFPDIEMPVFDDDGNIIGTHKDGAFGTADIVGTAKDRTVLIDWKMGAGVPVEAEGNEQLLYYAYAAAHTEPTSKFFDKHKPIELFIIQPRSREGEPFSRWLTNWVQLEAFALELRNAVRRSQEPDPPFNLGPHCRFCSAKTGCPLYTGKVEEAGALTPDQIAAELERWLPWADVMINWGQTVKDMAHGALESGAQIPGYKLVNKRAVRRWTDEDKTIKYFARMKLPADERYEKKLISPAKAEKALKPLGIAELPKDLVVSESSGTTLAPESDKRPAVLVGGGALKKLAERLSAG